MSSVRFTGSTVEMRFQVHVINRGSLSGDKGSEESWTGQGQELNKDVESA